MAILETEKKFLSLDPYEYETRFNDLVNEKDSKEWNIKKNDIDFEYKKISKEEHEKKKYTIEGEPYFCVIKSDFKDGKIEFVLDWNEIFIEKLKDEGMVGYNDQQMVDLYFKEICSQIAEEEEIFDFKNENFGPSIEKEELLGTTIYT